jgi:hypothetical protein
MTESQSWRPHPPTDPSGLDAPHDVLAADEFSIGTSAGRLPPDPHRFQPPHDILAAEEFAMPAAGQRREVEIPSSSGRGGVSPLILIAAAAVLLFLLRRRA